MTTYRHVYLTAFWTHYYWVTEEQTADVTCWLLAQATHVITAFTVGSRDSWRTGRTDSSGGPVFTRRTHVSILALSNTQGHIQHFIGSMKLKYCRLWSGFTLRLSLSSHRYSLRERHKITKNIQFNNPFSNGTSWLYLDEGDLLTLGPRAPMGPRSPWTPGTPGAPTSPWLPAGPVTPGGPWNNQ